MRIVAAKAIGRQGTGVDNAQQREQTDELARRIQTEPDPLVRESIVRAASKFDTPMATRILLSGLKDSDPFVRQTCCRILGRQKNVAATSALGEIVQADEDIDVRVAATRALGSIGTAETIPAIALALHDRDPALQYAAVGAMRLASGKDFGNDVAAWRTFAARSATPTRPSAPAVVAASGTSESSVADRPNGSARR